VLAVFAKTKKTNLTSTGSGFVISMFGIDSDFCQLVSRRTGAIVLDCDYAKGKWLSKKSDRPILTRTFYQFASGPEHPFPAAPSDVEDIISYVIANKDGYFDTSRVTIGGFSAGGTLALTASASHPKGTLKGQSPKMFD
jgi:acetyl esterase/lipase